MPNDYKPAILVLLFSVATLFIVWQLTYKKDTKKEIEYLEKQLATLPDPSPAPAPKAPIMTYKVGQMAEVEGNEITLQSWKKLSEHEALLEDIVSPSSNIYMLTVVAKNITTEKKRIHSGEIKVNHNGTILTYDEASRVDSYLELNPLEKGAGRFIFMIPKEATGDMFWYPYSYEESTVRFER